MEVRGSNDLPEWRKVARTVFSMSPVSASCELVFSLLNAKYGEQPHKALADHAQESFRMQYNNLQITDRLLCLSMQVCDDFCENIVMVKKYM